MISWTMKNWQVSLTDGLGLQRAKAAQELGRQKDRRAIRPFMTALTDKNSAVRNNAAYALESELIARIANWRLIKVWAKPSDM